MLPSYKRSQPKINDYNPLTHTTFYSAPDSMSPQKARPAYPNNNRNSPFMATASMQLSPFLATEKRFAKSRLRNEVFDPITGMNKTFNVQRSTGNSGTGMVLDRPKVERRDHIAGAMRKPVNEVAYVNIYALRTSSNMKDPALAQAANRFYGV